MNPNFRNFALWVVIFLLVLALVTLFQSPSQRASTNEIPYSQLINESEAGRIANVVVAGQEITGTFSDGRSFVTYAPYGDPALLKTLAQKGVQVSARAPSEGTPWFMALLVNSLPFVIFIGLWIFMSRQMQNGAGRAMGLDRKSVV